MKQRKKGELGREGEEKGKNEEQEEGMIIALGT